MPSFAGPVAAAVVGIVVALGAHSLLVGGPAAANALQSLGLSPLVGPLHRMVPNLGSLILGCIVLILGSLQIVSHIFHPAVIAVFGGRPKVTLTADTAIAGFEAVRERLVRELVAGHFLAVQCTVYWKGVAVVDLCGASNDVEVLAPPEEDQDDAKTQEHQDDTIITDCYNPYAVQAVAGPSIVVSQLCVAIAAERGWLKYDDRMAKHLPVVAAGGDSVGGAGTETPPFWLAVAQAAAIPVETFTVSQLTSRRAPTEEDCTASTTLVWHRAISQLLQRVDPTHRNVAAIVAAELCPRLGIAKGGLRHARQAHNAGTPPPAQQQQQQQKDAPGPPAWWFPVAPAAPVPGYKYQLVLLLERLRNCGRESSSTIEAARELEAARAHARATNSAPAAATSPPARALTAAAGVVNGAGWLANARSLAKVAAMLSMRGECQPESGNQPTGAGLRILSAAVAGKVATAPGSRDDRIEGWESGSPLAGLYAEGGTDGFIGWDTSLQLGMAITLVGNHPLPSAASHPVRLLARSVLDAAQHMVDELHPLSPSDARS